MPSELSMESVLSAINDLKAEVARLATGLHAAEERIASLEATAYTPPSSPATSDSLSEPLQQGPTVEPNTSDRSSPENRLGDKHGSTPGPGQQVIKMTASTRSECPANSPCDIQQHLKPINDGLAAIAKQLSRIELVINHPTPINAPAPAGSDCGGAHDSCDVPQAKRTPPKEVKGNHGAHTTQPTAPPRPSKLRNSLESSIGCETALESPSSVFGRPSTPSHRFRSVNVAGSPFGNYSDEKSPFSQLGKQGVKTSSGFGAKSTPSSFNFAFNGLTLNPQKGFGTPGPTR